MEDLTSLELHRQRLEENVTKLRTALRHWKTWDAEYEGLKEELLALGENPSAEKIVSELPSRDTAGDNNTYRIRSNCVKDLEAS